MLGAIIGDIIGSRFEFNNHLSTDFALFTKDCAFTDDTICTIAVADALLKGVSFQDSIHAWCKRYPHPKGGYGGRFVRWVHSENPHPYKSFGNGSAMRVSPCAWLSNDRRVILANARKSAECSHNHPEGIRGAMAVADAIYQASTGLSKEKIAQTISRQYGYNLHSTCDTIRRNNTFDETCQVTVPQAIVCLLESTSFEDAIRLAVSIGGDSDTIAAITGSIAEALYKGTPQKITTKALAYLPQEMKDVMHAYYRFIIKNYNQKKAIPAD